MNSDRRKFIFVVSCPRSGSSLFAKLLTRCGLRTIQSYAHRNRKYPSGYFESLHMHMFLRAMEEMPRGRQDHISTEPFLTPEYLADPFVAQMFGQAFSPVINRTVDFMKHPQLALCGDFLLQQFPGIHLIALWREPRPTFRSLVTKELSYQTLPSSGFKAVFLWNTYAYHIVRTKRAYPADVTVLNIDDIRAERRGIQTLLEQLGYERVGGVTLQDCMEPGAWTRRPGLVWSSYFAAMELASHLLQPLLPRDKALLASASDWRARLREVTTHYAST